MHQASDMENQLSLQIRDEQICEEMSKYEHLQSILKKMISTSTKEICAEYKTLKKNNPSSSDIVRPELFVSIRRPDESDVGDLALALTNERKQLGRRIKNPVICEKVVCYSIPEDFDVEGIENIEEIKDRLGKWRIQRRQRETKMNDTYYCHLISRQTFRSIPEVLNFIMHGTRKRNASDMASTSEGGNIMVISKSFSKKQRKAKGKMVVTSHESSSSPESTTSSNLELSMVPWNPFESEMDMYHSHPSSSLIQWNPQPLKIIPCEPEASSICRGKENVTQEVNFVDLTEESDDEENRIIHSNSEMTEFTKHKVDNCISWSPLKNLADVALDTAEHKACKGFEMFGDHYSNLSKDPVRQINADSDIPVANEKEIEKENQGLIRTEPVVESLTITESSNKQNQNLQQNSGPAEKFATLEEAKQKLAHVELEGVDDDDDDEFQQVVSFSQPDDLVNHILDYDYDYNNVVDFLFRD